MNHKRTQYDTCRLPSCSLHWACWVCQGASGFSLSFTQRSVNNESWKKNQNVCRALCANCWVCTQSSANVTNVFLNTFGFYFSSPLFMLECFSRLYRDWDRAELADQQIVRFRLIQLFRFCRNCCSQMTLSQILPFDLNICSLTCGGKMMRMIPWHSSHDFTNLRIS